MYIVATMMLVQRFALAGRETERKIIRIGMVTKIITIIKKPYEISNTNTFPSKTPFMEPGIYKWK